MDENNNKNKFTGFKKYKVLIAVVTTLIIVIIVALASLEISGFFRKGIPNAEPVIAIATEPHYGNPDSMVWFVFDDGSFFQFSFGLNSDKPGVNYETLFENDIEIPAMKYMVNLIYPYNSIRYWNESSGVIIKMNYYYKMSEPEYQSVLDAIENSNYSEWNSIYNLKAFDVGYTSMRIWNDNSSIAFTFENGTGPDEFYNLRDFLFMLEFKEAT